MAGILDTSSDGTFKSIDLGKTGLIVVFIAYFILLFTLSKNEKNILSGDKVALYLTGAFIPVLILCYFLFSSMKDTKYLFFLVVIFGVIIIFLLFRSLFPSSDSIFLSFTRFFTDVTPLPNIPNDYSFVLLLTLKLLLISMALIGLTIVYNVFLNEGYRQQETSGFILYCLFYIPCLINDYFVYLFQEFKDTPIVVYALIGLELLLLFAYILLPRLLNKITFTDGQVLLQNPTYFYNKQTISNITPFYTNNKDIYLNDFDETNKDDKTKKTVKREYAISMWITTNNPTFGSDDCMMFRFGTDSEPTVGCPYISCTKEGKWRFVFSNVSEDNAAKKKKVTTELVVPMQRWNYVVLNYHNDEVDLFINGKLMETVHLENSVLPNYKNEMNVCIGSDTNELHGAICNLIVFPKILSITQISQSYNILRLQNPPLNNLR